MPSKPFKDYTIKELQDFIKKNEEKLELLKQVPYPNLETIKSQEQTENSQREAAAELTRKLKEKNPKSP